jgi:acyl-CoA synthetase (NDP forming)
VSEYKIAKVCDKCAEPYIVKVLNCGCGHDHDESFKIRRNKDFPLELILRDIKENTDIQIGIVAEHNNNLRRELRDMKEEHSDQWEQYLDMNGKTAQGRLLDNSCRLMAELDSIAAEG